MYVIFALPRSRTAWLSTFLTYKDWTCQHEAALTVRGLGDIKALMERPNYGYSETAAAPCWQLIKYSRPDVKFIVIRRDVDDAIQSMLLAGAAADIRFDLDILRRNYKYMNECLDRIAEQPTTLSLQYYELNNEYATRRLFEFCLPYSFDEAWWEKLRHKNIQPNLRSFFSDFNKVRDRVEMAKVQLRQDMARLAKSGELQQCL